MAKVNFGPLANDARGKINGIVYSKNKSGAYTRKKVTPANPNSAAQSFVRGNFGVLSQAWSSTLSDVERSQWIAYANTYPRLDVFGASINITGANMFTSLNQRLLQIGQSVVSTPPPSNVVAPIPFDPFSLVATNPGTLVFDETASSPSGSSSFYIFGARPLPAGRTVQKNDWRFLGVFPAAVGPYPASIAVSTEYVDAFGNFVAGQNISLLVSTIDISSGLVTVGTSLSIIAV